MNLIEADSREFLLSRFHRRVESYRTHHDQNYRLYQPIRREEVRKQLEETSQLHKRWIEFQAKRSVGKAKNDTFVSNAPTFNKKPRKKPAIPEFQFSQSYKPTILKKSVANVCQNFNKKNEYKKVDKSCENTIKHDFNLESDMFQSSNNEISNHGNKLSLDKNSSLAEHFQYKKPDDNYEKMDDEREIDNIFLGEEWDKFWDSISKEGEIMPKEVLKVLQENEICDDLTSASINQNFFQDSISVCSSNYDALANGTLSTSFVSCDIKSNFNHSVLQSNHINSFIDQRLIRNDPNCTNHIPFNHNNTSSKFSFIHGNEFLPSYDDVVSGRFVPSLIQHKNMSNTEASGQSHVHQQQFYHQKVQKNVICRKENDSINFIPYQQNNIGIISESNFYHPAAQQNIYSNDFQNYGGEGRFYDFQNQSYCKMNCENYEFLNIQPESLTSQQLYLGNDSEMCYNTDRNHFYWSSNDNYQKEDDMNTNSYSNNINFLQPFHNNLKHFDTTNLSTPAINNSRRICMDIMQQQSPTDISVEAELSLIQDIINKK